MLKNNEQAEERHQKLCESHNLPYINTKKEDILMIRVTSKKLQKIKKKKPIRTNNSKKSNKKRKNNNGTDFTENCFSSF